MTQQEEFDLITNAMNGHLESYSLLVKKYQNMVLTLSCRILKDRHEAEDLTQDVFIKVFKNLSKFDPQATFAAWLYKVSYNETINKYRSLKRRQDRFKDSDGIKEDWQTEYESLSLLDKQERKEILLAALDQLSESDRLVIWAYYFDDMTVKEISCITDLTESNIKIKLHRSRKQLYGILNRKHLKENLF